MSGNATQANGGRGPNGGRDAGDRFTLIALCVLSALFFAGALAYAVGGGLLAGDGRDGRANRDGNELPREWANMIPLQPLGPELEAQAEEGDGLTEGARADAERNERRPGFAGAGPVAQASPVGPSLVRVVRAPIVVAPTRLRLVRPIVRSFLAPVPQLRDLSPIAVDLPDTPDAPSLPGVPGDDVTIPDIDPFPDGIDIDIPEIDPFPGPGGIEIPPIDPFPGGSPPPPLDPLPGGTGGILLQSTAAGSPTTTLRPLSTEAGAQDVGGSSFDPLVLAAADAGAGKSLTPSRLKGEAPEPETAGGKAQAEGEADDAEPRRSDRSADAPGKPSRRIGRDARRRAGERREASRPAPRSGGEAPAGEGTPPPCPDAVAQRRPAEPAERRCRAQEGEGRRDADRGAEPPRKAGRRRPPVDGREPAGGPDDD